MLEGTIGAIARVAYHPGPIRGNGCPQPAALNPIANGVPSMKRFFVIAMILAAAGCGKAEDKAYSVPGLLDMLKDKDPKVRYTAVSQLGKYGSQAKEVVPALADALKDPDTSVRMGAAYALAKI